jgi:hypothetical protein
MPEGGGVTGRGEEAVEAGDKPVFGIVSITAEKLPGAILKKLFTLKFHGLAVAGPETPGPAVFVSIDNGNVISIPSLKVVTGAVPIAAKGLQEGAPAVALRMPP